MREISRIVKELLACQRGLWSVEFVCLLLSFLFSWSVIQSVRQLYDLSFLSQTWILAKS